jgi:hypothetical protein
VSERERANTENTETETQKRTNTQRRTDRGKFADGTVKVVADMSAEERSFARSIRFRKKIRSWMRANEGETWSTMGELHRDVANYSGCSMTTAARWVYQFSGPGQEWQIVELEDVFQLSRRMPMPTVVFRSLSE